MRWFGIPEEERCEGLNHEWNYLSGRIGPQGTRFLNQAEFDEENENLATHVDRMAQKSGDEPKIRKLYANTKSAMVRMADELRAQHAGRS